MERQFVVRFVLLVALPFYCLVNGSHFRGGLIQWRTLEDIVPGNDVKVEFTYRIGWRRSYSGSTRCDQSTIDAGVLTGIGGDLRCRVGCTGVGSVTTLNYFCTDFSATEDWTVGERSFEFSVPAVPLFEASFTSGGWISLVQGGGNWEVRVKLNFNQTLSVGRRQNASPQTKMAPVLRLQQGCNHTISIPVEDMDGDDVRCRWSESSMGECAGVCKTFPDADLDERECTIKYQATGRIGYYAVALQVEDFANAIDTVPMSSVPLQFLVNVYSSDESCYSKPDFDELTQEDGACVGVPPNTTYHTQLTAVAGGPGVGIADITTQSPPGMVKSDLQPGRLSTHWYVNMTWTPTLAQNGPNIFCYLATDSTQRTSDQRCTTLLGGVTPPSVVPESITPTYSVYPTHTLWKLTFDRPIYRPKRTAYFRVYSSTGREIYKSDTSTSSDVIFPDPDVTNELTITTSRLPFVEKQTYYILLDDGIVVGPEFCGPESPRVGDSNFWQFTIKDVTPPKITFTVAPQVTAANSTVSWGFDEEADVVCALQGPDSTLPVPCPNHTYQGVRLAEGDYTLYIQASDLEGNNQQYTHRWHVDLTRPTVQFISKTNPFSNDSSVLFRFQCVDYTSCTFNCKLSNNVTEGKYQVCTGQHRLTGLQQGQQRLSVQATDAVGNVGSPVEHSWIVDTQAPTIELPANASVTCGDPITPTALGFPVTRDQYDPAPKLTFVDVAADACKTFRNWKAVDRAGNTKTLTQVISFTNPRPPRVTGHTQLYVACGSVDTIYDKNYIFTHGLLNVSHPCERDMDVAFVDSAPIDSCGVDITRQWTITDDCGGVSYFTQDIKVLKQSDPEEPEDGQVNVPLDQRLRWPQFPGSTTYRVYIWLDGEDEPESPVAILSSRTYYPRTKYPPNTRLLWRVGYLVRGENETREIPSPVWGMITRALADLVLTKVEVPPSAFSGSEVSIQWTVENKGNLSTSASAQYWYDVVFLGRSSDLADAREVARVTQRRYVDPSDGYQATTDIKLLQNDIGNFYVFVRVDLYKQVDDYNLNNNLLQAVAPIKVQLTPPPNLVVKSVFSLGSSFSGKSSTIRWSVQNLGIGITQTADWTDAVFLSDDDVLDESDTLLATVPHKGALISNGEYSAVAHVTIPNAIYGTFYIFVHTDYYKVVYEHTDESDNTKSLETQIVLSPTPDLVLTELNVGTDLQTGDVMEIKFTVKNNGAGSPFEPWWTDSCSLSFVDTGGIYYNSEQTHTQVLHPGNSYSGSCTYRIPPTLLSGTYQLSVHTDNRNRVFEFNADDNNKEERTINIRQSLPDLQVKGGSVQLTEEPQATILTYNVTILNRGEGGLFDASWVDEIYLSHVADPPKSLLTLLSRHRRSADVEAGESYQVTGSYPLPLAQHGMVYIYVATDIGNDVKEESESNNMLEVSQTTIPKRAGDLTISQAEVSQYRVVAGETIVVQWTDENEGNLAVHDWYDSIYLRRGESDTQNSILLLRVEVRRSLDPGGRISNTQNVSLPLETAGDYSLVITTGQFSTMQETNTQNNNFATGITILTPASPDLKVEDVQHELRENSRVLVVTARVTNAGNSILQPLSWRDKVTLVEGGDSSGRELATTETSVTQTLLALQSYTLTHVLVIPHHLHGYFKLAVAVDVQNDIVELFGENNNNWLTVSPIQIPRTPYPHITVDIDGSSVPNELLSGDMVAVKYSVTNTEGTDVALSSWTDGLYLYSRGGAPRREVIEDGLFFGNQLYNADIQIGETVSGEIGSRVPYGVTGQWYIYVVVDINSRLGIPEGSVAHFYPVSFDVRSGPLPDLSVSLASDNVIQMKSGQLYQISFTISNLGNSSASGMWYDTVYLSDDPLVDPFDIKLKTSLRVQDLGKGNSYTQAIEVFIPFDLPGSSYYLIAEGNIDQMVFETTHENNYGVQIVSIQSAPAVDIITKDVTHSKSSATYSDPVRYSWKLQNAGSVPFSGYKCDSVYLSPDNRWDIGDVAVSGPTCEGFTLAALTGTKSYSATAPIPKVTEGTYSAIVRTRNNARDHNLSNNIATSVTQISVAPPYIAMNQRKTVTIKENADLVLKVKDVPAGIALLVTLVTTNDKAYHQMYLKFAEPPKPYSYDSASKERLTLNQRVSVTYTRGNTYYLLVESISTTEKSYQLTLEVKEAKFELNSVTPPTVAPFGNATLRLTGMLFGQNLQACVFPASDDSQSRCSLSLARIDSEQAYATFSMEGALLGKYTIRLTDIDSGKETEVEDGVEVIQEVGGRLVLELVPPAPLRAGQRALVVANVHNTGYSDLPTPLVVVASSGNSEVLRVDSESSVQPSQSLTFLGMSAGQPGDVLPPRSSRQFAFHVFPNNGFVGTERLVITETPDSQLTRFLSETREMAKPNNLDPDVWEVVYNNFLSCTGEGADSIKRRVREVGNILNSYSTVAYSVPDIINNLLLIADGGLTPLKLFDFVDIQDETTRAFPVLLLRRMYSSSLSVRRTQGLLGRGWVVPWLEIRIEKIDRGLLLISSRREYTFYPNDAGQYYSLALPGHMIMADSDFYTYETGSLSFVLDVQDGMLREIVDIYDRESKLTVEYGDVLPKSMTHSQGTRLEFHFNSVGISQVQLFDANDLLLKEGKYTYDSEDQLIEFVSGGQVVSYDYNSLGDLIKIVYSSGEEQRLEYDSRHWLTRVVTLSASGVTLSDTRLEQTCNGEMTVTELPVGITSTFTFGIGGVLLAQRPSVGLPATYIRNPTTASTAVKIGDDLFKEESYDAEREVMTHTSANGDKLEFFIQDGQIVKTADNLGVTSENTYKDGLVETTTYSDGRSRHFSYNSDGLVSTVKLEDDTDLSFEYDGQKNIISKQTVRGDVQYSYDSQNRLTEIRTDEGVTRLEYTESGLPAKVVYPEGPEVVYKYNQYLQRTQVTSSGGYHVKYDYDNKRRLSSVEDGSGTELIRFAFDASGRIAQRILGNGMYTNYTYDDNSMRLKEMKVINADDTALTWFRYSYDSRGYRMSLDTNEGTYKYRYDTSGQLVYWESPNGQKEEITYDSRQNRITKSISGTTLAYKINSVNQYTEQGNYKSYKYDGLGNMVEETEQRGRNVLSNKYTFDQEKHLRRFEDRNVRCEYKYTVFGTLNKKSCTDGSEGEYLIDPFGPYGAAVLVQKENAKERHVYHALEQGLVGIGTPGTADIEYYMFNGEGSTLHVADNLGQLLSTYSYDPFGNQLGGPAKDSNTYRFMGKYGTRHLNESSNLYVMGARVYSAELGRFISVDPIGMVGSPTNPYTYGHNNPLSYHDPHGLAILPLIAAGALIGAITGAAANAITQGINIAASGGSFSDFSFGDVGGAAVAGGITGLAITTGAALPAVFGGGALATATGLTVTGAGGFLGGFIGSAVSDGLNGRPFDVGAAQQNGIINGIGAYVPWSMLGYGGKGASAFGSPYMRMNFGTAISPWRTTGSSIWKSLGLGNAIGILPGLRPGSWLIPPWLDPNVPGECPIPWIQSMDPNDILGPVGYGESNFIAAGLSMDYTIRFENDANATAPAQKVTIRSLLDSDLDITSFRLGSFGFGEVEINLEYTSPFHQQLVNASEETGAFVYFQAGFDAVRGEATWLLQAIDAETGLPPADPRVGFLPPNNGTSGQGFVSFRIQHNEQIVHGSRLDASASIIFDENAPIETPPIFHTIDNIAPNASLGQVSPGTAGVLVNLLTSDSGSGVKYVDVYVLEDSGQVTRIAEGVNQTMVVLPLAAGEQHNVLLTAVDFVGNSQRLHTESYYTVNFEVNCTTDCSGNGVCGVDGICSCHDGFFGQDCSQVYKGIDPPIIDFSYDNGTEDQPITTHVSARLANDDTASLVIQVSNISPKAKFNKGSSNGESIDITPTDFGAVLITTPKHFSGKVNFTLAAVVSKDGSSTRRTLSVSIPVEPKADQPILTVSADCYSGAGPFHFTVSSRLVDEDGSEVLALAVGEETVTVGRNSIVVAAGTRSILVTATATETANGNTATTSTEVILRPCDSPTSTKKPTNGQDHVKAGYMTVTYMALAMVVFTILT